jgi:transcriptional regulator with XRE-family HTH domain
MKKLREIRQRMGVGIRELEKRTGYSRSYISNIENGKQRANTDFLESVAKALNIDVVELFSVSEETERSIVDNKILNEIKNYEDFYNDLSVNTAQKIKRIVEIWRLLNKSSE